MLGQLQSSSLTVIILGGERMTVCIQIIWKVSYQRYGGSGSTRQTGLAATAREHAGAQLRFGGGDAIWS